MSNPFAPDLSADGVEEALDILERVERFVYEIEVKDDPDNDGIGNLAHAPAIATARAILAAALREAQELIADYQDWHDANCGCDRPGNESCCILEHWPVSSPADEAQHD